jgi:hypothetical protein
VELPTAVSGDIRWQRFFALNGLVFIVLCLVGLEVFWPQPPSFALSPQETARFYADHQTGFLIGITLCELAMAFYVMWTIQIGTMLWRLDRGAHVKTIAATACGLATPFILAADLAVFAVAAYRPAQTDPAITQALSDTAWIGSELFWPILAAEMALIAVIMIQSKGRPDCFPAWLGWYTVFAAAAEPFQAAIIFTEDGPLAPDGLLTWYLAVGSWGLWAAATSITMFRMLSGSDRHDGVEQRAPDTARTRLA